MTHFSKTRGRGIHFPRLYDFIMFALTKGHRDAYRRAVLDAVKIRSGDSVLDVGGRGVWHRGSSHPSQADVGTEWNCRWRRYLSGHACGGSAQGAGLARGCQLSLR